MGREARKGIRRKIRQGARLARIDGSVLGSCTLLDVSATGARLKLESSDALPEQVVLLLSYDTKLRRLCSVAWQEDSIAGLQFKCDQQAIKAIEKSTVTLE
jgi:hypothetical protein